MTSKKSSLQIKTLLRNESCSTVFILLMSNIFFFFKKQNSNWWFVYWRCIVNTLDKIRSRSFKFILISDGDEKWIFLDIAYQGYNAKNILVNIIYKPTIKFETTLCGYSCLVMSQSTLSHVPKLLRLILSFIHAEKYD